MESKPTKTEDQHAYGFAGISDDSERLRAILSANLEIKREKENSGDARESFERDLMAKPVNFEKAYGLFGLMLGIFTPLSLLLSIILRGPNSGPEDRWIIALLLFVNAVCGAVGYFSGKHIIAGLARKAESSNWLPMLLLLPLIGILWGVLTGGAGGIFLFVIGAIPGAVVASIVGIIGITLFAPLHRLLKKADSIEQKHFMPLALGITAIICAAIFGLDIR